MAKIRDGSTYLGQHLTANDYYSEHESVVGEWVGRGAERLGLRGEIRAGDHDRTECSKRSGAIPMNREIGMLDTRLPDTRSTTSLPIRAFDLPEMLAGDEPLTSRATHPLGSGFSLIVAGRELLNRSGST